MIMRGLVWLILFFSFLCLIILLLVLPFTVKIQISVFPESSQFVLSVRPPLSPIYFNVPGLLKKDISVRKRQMKQHSRTRLTGIAEKIPTVVGRLRLELPRIRVILDNLKNTLKIHELSMEGRVGLRDAFGTALLCGTLSSTAILIVKSLKIYGLLLKQSPRIKFEPVYEGPHLSFRLYSVFTVKPWRLAKVSLLARKLMHDILSVEY